MNHYQPAGDAVFMVLIAGRKQKDALLTALLETGAHLINTTYARGTVKASFLKSAFGLVPEEHKVVVTCVLTQAKACAALRMLSTRFHFDQPNTGVAFTIPVDRLSF